MSSVHVQYGMSSMVYGGMSHLQSIADLTRQRLEVVKIFVSGHLMSFTVVSLAIKMRIRWHSFVLVLVLGFLLFFFLRRFTFVALKVLCET